MSDFNTNKSTMKLRDDLESISRQYDGDTTIFASSAMTNPGYISSARTIMLNSHLRQYTPLVKGSEHPLVFTGAENMAGQFSSGYYKSDAEYEIIAKVNKFWDLDHLYVLFVQNTETGEYDVIEKKNVEDLVERFGYRYNTEGMDSKEVGDTIDKDEVLYSSTSYDENMNFSYGKNIPILHLLDTDTIEDGIKMGLSVANSFLSAEVETTNIHDNDNDILCDAHGKGDEYKPLPDILDNVDEILCYQRRIINSQVMFDLKKSNLRKKFSTDTFHYSHGTVYDINIFCNKTMEEIEEGRNFANEQVYKYLKNQHRYYSEIYEITSKLKESGCKVSRDINYLHKRALQMIDPKFKWKDEEGSIFSNMIIQIQVVRDVPVKIGSKTTGRHGNKGVVVKIVPDEDMPITEDKRRVGAIFNTLGVINRLNSFQLIEKTINSMTYCLVKKLRTIDNFDEKFELVHMYVNRFHEREAENLKVYYNKLNQEEKVEFFDTIDKNGIYIQIEPLFEKKEMFTIIQQLYKDFDWIEKSVVFVKKFGRHVPIMKRLVVGELYLLKLKQTSKKGFSARSTASVGRKELPEKSSAAKYNKEMYPRTPIRLGIDETLGLGISSSTNNIAMLHLYLRSSPAARNWLGRALLTDIDGVKELKKSTEFVNRNIQYFDAITKILGFRNRYGDEKYVMDFDLGRAYSKEYNGKLVIGTKSEFNDYKIKDEAQQIMKQKCFIGSKEDYDNELNRIEQELKDIDACKYISVKREKEY